MGNFGIYTIELVLMILASTCIYGLFSARFSRKTDITYVPFLWFAHALNVAYRLLSFVLKSPPQCYTCTMEFYKKASQTVEDESKTV